MDRNQVIAAVLLGVTLSALLLDGTRAYSDAPVDLDRDRVQEVVPAAPAPRPPALPESELQRPQPVLQALA